MLPDILISGFKKSVDGRTFKNLKELRSSVALVKMAAQIFNA